MNSPRPPTLPPHARRPINRCNLPAVILGGLTYQRHPAPLLIDGVEELHHQLIEELERHDSKAERESIFVNYMAAHFSLAAPEEAGGREGKRRRADYRRVVRGWSVDPDNREAAVLKAWVESRFGLCPLYHREPLTEGGEAHRRYLHEATSGLYNTNALEHQLDLLYRYAQFELAKDRPEASHITLYRGINRFERHGLYKAEDGERSIILLNNINSFTRNRERAEEFGDYILSAEVPSAKVLCYSGLLRGLLRGEEEYMLLGGIYAVGVSYF